LAYGAEPRLIATAPHDRLDWSMARMYCQDTLVKRERTSLGAEVTTLRLVFRIAHNTSLYFLRRFSRNTGVPLAEDFRGIRPCRRRISSAVRLSDVSAAAELHSAAGDPQRMCWAIRSDRSRVSPVYPPHRLNRLQRGRWRGANSRIACGHTAFSYMSRCGRQKMAVFGDLFRTGDCDAIPPLLPTT